MHPARGVEEPIPEHPAPPPVRGAATGPIPAGARRRRAPDWSGPEQAPGPSGCPQEAEHRREGLRTVLMIGAVVPSVAGRCRLLPSGFQRLDQPGGQPLQPPPCSAFTATASACWPPSPPTGQINSCSSLRPCGWWSGRSPAGPGPSAESVGWPRQACLTWADGQPVITSPPTPPSRCPRPPPCSAARSSAGCSDRSGPFRQGWCRSPDPPPPAGRARSRESA